VGYPHSRNNGGHSGGFHEAPPYSTLKGYPTGTNFKVGQRMEPRGGHSWFNPGRREGVSSARAESQ